MPLFPSFIHRIYSFRSSLRPLPSIGRRFQRRAEANVYHEQQSPISSRLPERREPHDATTPL